MKLYTPADIAKFVACNDLGDASEREIIDALKSWDKDARPDGAWHASRGPGGLPAATHGDAREAR